jgi:hypothetical protein
MIKKSGSQERHKRANSTINKIQTDQINLSLNECAKTNVPSSN